MYQKRLLFCMSELMEKIIGLIESGNIKISEHGYDQLSDDGLFVRDVLYQVRASIVVEEYLEYPKGPCILLLQRTEAGIPVHVLWGIPKNCHCPAVLVTAYLPDPQKWTSDLLRRLP